MLYAVSESGVMVLPVGSLNSSHRVAATQEDLLVATNFCNTGVLSQSLTITDPGGGQTDFALTTSQPGVTILARIGNYTRHRSGAGQSRSYSGFRAEPTAITLTLTSQQRRQSAEAGSAC